MRNLPGKYYLGFYVLFLLFCIGGSYAVNIGGSPDIKHTHKVGNNPPKEAAYAIESPPKIEQIYIMIQNNLSQYIDYDFPDPNAPRLGPVRGDGDGFTAYLPMINNSVFIGSSFSTRNVSDYRLRLINNTLMTYTLLDGNFRILINQTQSGSLILTNFTYEPRNQFAQNFRFINYRISNPYLETNGWVIPIVVQLVPYHVPCSQTNCSICHMNRG